MRLLALTPVIAVLLAGCSFSAGPEEANKVLAARAFEEILSKGNFERASELYDQNFVNHGLHRDRSLTEDMDAAKGWRLAFPDGKTEVQQMVADKDLVSVLWVARGTNTGSGGGLPATGKAAELRGITIWRMLDGRIREEWSAFDQLSLMRQLGLLPSSGQ
ncbi:MAG TPA: ester cyclase [Steroidobacteraceae bacterium]|nr:ester cyclase [Steroidobacteraceae bacterium]